MKQIEVKPIQNQAVGDLALSEYPSFWFYIPYTSGEISTLEFELKDISENKIIYQTAGRKELVGEPIINASLVKN